MAALKEAFAAYSAKVTAVWDDYRQACREAYDRARVREQGAMAEYSQAVEDIRAAPS
jgi:hypothetical protein